MNAGEPGPELNQLTEKIIGCAYTVSNELGCGFVERVYENALAYELRQSGLGVVQQHPIKVHYHGVVVGDYTADMVVEETVLVELKAASSLSNVHTAQCMNYLRATGIPICLLMNFGRPKVQIQRIAGRRGA